MSSNAINNVTHVLVSICSNPFDPYLHFCARNPTEYDPALIFNYLGFKITFQ